MACFAASPLGIDQHQMLARAHDRIDQAEVAVAVVQQHADAAAGMLGDLLGEGVDLAVGVAPGVFHRPLRLAGVDQERPPRVGAAEMAEGAVERYGYGEAAHAGSSAIQRGEGVDVEVHRHLRRARSRAPRR